MEDRFPVDGRDWESDRTGAECTYYTRTGNPLEVVVTERDDRPPKSWLQQTWNDRRAGRSIPVLLITTYDRGGEREAVLCGPSGEEPDVVRGVDPDQLVRVGAVGLEKPSQIAVRRFLGEAVEKLGDDLVGVRNQGLLATHELREGVPERGDWDTATNESVPLLDKAGQALVEGLGYEIERGDGYEYVLKHGSSGRQQAVAVFIDDGDAFDQPSDQFGDTPVGYALNAAESHNLDYVVASDGDRLRLYTTDPSASFGSRGRTDTYVEVDTSLLSPGRAGYLWLLFSADALRDGGTLAEIQLDSEEYAADLSERLRERIYDDVVPDLAEAIAVARDVDDLDREQLDETYEMALYLLYRLLFVAYAEDERHLPRYAEGYERRSLKETAKELHQISQEESVTFDDSTTYWDDLQRLFTAIHDGQSAWGLPEYDGTLLSSDPEMSPAGARLAEIELTDEVFAPILYRLLVDETPEEGVKGPVDFRDIGVREFGVIYEGLLESELSQADRDLRTDDGQYVPADEDIDPEDVVVEAGEVYLHGLSGERKATGTYYTKSTFVEHLLDHSLEPALEDHLAELDEMSDAEAAANFFDFRVADVAMGSGHFLVGAVDRIEKAFSDYLAERQLARVENELETLRTEAREKFTHTDAEPEIERDQVLRRQIARRCVYGVDLNPLATELARLSLWIHTFVPGLPLTFLDYNLRTGDALAGVGTLDEVDDELDLTDDQQVSLGDFADTAGTDVMDEIETKIDDLGQFADASAAEVAEARTLRAEIETQLSDVDARFDVLAAARIDDDDRVDTSVVSDQHVDDVTITSSYDAATGLLESVDAFHFPTGFPEVFVGENPGFDCLVGNPPWEQTKVEKNAFWARHFPGLHRGMSSNEREQKIAELEETRPDLKAKLNIERKEQATRRNIIVNGPFPGASSGDPDLYQAFVWRFWRLVSNRSYIGMILPRGAFLQKGGEEFREEILSNGDIRNISFLKNKSQWVFDIHTQKTIGLLSVKRQQDSGTVPIEGPHQGPESFESNVDGQPLHFSVDNVRSWTDVAAFPILPSVNGAIEAFKKLQQSPRISKESAKWEVRPYRNGITRKDCVDDPDATEGDLWPVYKGESFNIWNPDTGTYYGKGDVEELTSYLQSKRENAKNHPRSVYNRINNEIIEDESTLSCRSPRIAFRRVTQRDNSRTVLASLIPPNVFMRDADPFLLWPAGDEKDEAYLIGVLSSVPLDWFARRFVEEHLDYYIFNGLPVPRPGRDFTLRQRVVELAGRLAAVDDRYADWADAVGVDYGPLTESEKEAKIHELDAVVAHLYGLTREHVEVIFETFHDNWDHEPRLAAVLEWYDEWKSQNYS